MEDYQKRMIEEFNELGGRIEKLEAKLKDESFVNSIGNGKVNLLYAQLGAMFAYHRILASRIKLENIKEFQKKKAETNQDDGERQKTE